MTVIGLVLRSRPHSENVRNDGVKAKCVIWHDDAVTSGAEGVYAHLQKYGWSATEATEATIYDQLVAGGATGYPYPKYVLDGWALASHTNLAAEHTNVPATSVQSQAYRNKYAAMQYGADGRDVALWGGLSAAVAYPVFQRTYRSARTFILDLTLPEMQPPSDPHAMKALGISGGETFDSTLKLLVDRAIAIRGIAQFVYHQDIDSNSTITTEFDKLLAYLDTQRANIDVVTIDDAVSPLTVGYTATPRLPTTPFTITATVGNTQVVLGRTGGAGTKVAIKLYRGSTATGNTIATSMPFTDTGLTNGTAVTYIATSTNTAGTVTSNTITVTPVAPTPAPGTAADNFNRADSTTTLGTASDGGTWTVVTGTWGISSNQAYDVSGSGAHVVRDLGSANQYVQAHVTGALVLISRHSSANTWYGILSNGSSLTMYKNNNGTLTNLGSPGSIAAGDFLYLSAVGTTLTVKVNGVTRGTNTDSTSTLTGTAAGMRSDVSTSRFDDFAAATM